MFVYKIGFKTLSVLKSSSARFEGNSVWETVNLCELILCKVEVTFSVVLLKKNTNFGDFKK